MKQWIIAIDGPVGSGKSTLARRVAELMGYIYIDTGAMYRALALKALNRGLSLDADAELESLAQATRIDLQANSGVRHVLVAEQRRAGIAGGVVMEGRDIGSVVFPEAELKIFLTASPEIRAQRRWREHQQKGDQIDLQRTLEEIRERDKRDVGRATSPLVRAADAVFVDSTAMEPEEVAKLVVMLANDGLARRATK
jgi:cytidylate kinase